VNSAAWKRIRFPSFGSQPKGSEDNRTFDEDGHWILWLEEQ
jgi:hypothetical protein